MEYIDIMWLEARFLPNVLLRGHIRGSSYQHHRQREAPFRVSQEGVLAAGGKNATPAAAAPFTTCRTDGQEDNKSIEISDSKK